MKLINLYPESPRKKEKIQITSIRNEKEAISTDPMNIKKIIKECCEQIYPRPFENLHKMDKFPERHRPPECTQGEMDNVNRLISTKKIELIINDLSKQKAPDPDGFTGELYQTLKE